MVGVRGGVCEGERLCAGGGRESVSVCVCGPVCAPVSLSFSTSAE
eukprot:COSAG05_NODE_23753_length_256_cov_0.496815_1_plen_44_part_10